MNNLENGMVIPETPLLRQPREEKDDPTEIENDEGSDELTAEEIASIHSLMAFAKAEGIA